MASGSSTSVLLPTKFQESTPVQAVYPTSTKIIYPTATLISNNPEPTLNSQSSHKYAQVSHEISYAAIRRSEGYQSKDDSIDIIAKVPAGETVEILGGPNHADGLVWWYVAWNGYQGWMADHTGSGKTILIFTP